MESPGFARQDDGQQGHRSSPCPLWGLGRLACLSEHSKQSSQQGASAAALALLSGAMQPPPRLLISIGWVPITGLQVHGRWREGVMESGSVWKFPVSRSVHRSPWCGKVPCQGCCSDTYHDSRDAQDYGNMCFERTVGKSSNGSINRQNSQGQSRTRQFKTSSTAAILKSPQGILRLFFVKSRCNRRLCRPCSALQRPVSANRRHDAFFRS